MTPPQLVFSLNVATPLLNQWQRLHWTERRKLAKKISRLVWAATNRRRPKKPWRRCAISITRVSPRVLPDWDGLYGGMKPLLDAFVVASRRHPNGLGIIADDDPKCVVALSCVPQIGPAATHVVIADLSAEHNVPQTV